MDQTHEAGNRFFALGFRKRVVFERIAKRWPLVRANSCVGNISSMGRHDVHLIEVDPKYGSFCVGIRGKAPSDLDRIERLAQDCLSSIRDRLAECVEREMGSTHTISRMLLTRTTNLALIQYSWHSDLAKFAKSNQTAEVDSGGYIAVVVILASHASQLTPEEHSDLVDRLVRLRREVGFVFQLLFHEIKGRLRIAMSLRVSDLLTRRGDSLERSKVADNHAVRQRLQKKRAHVDEILDLMLD